MAVEISRLFASPKEEAKEVSNDDLFSMMGVTVKGGA